MCVWRKPSPQRRGRRCRSRHRWHRHCSGCRRSCGRHRRRHHHNAHRKPPPGRTCSLAVRRSPLHRRRRPPPSSCLRAATPFCCRPPPGVGFGPAACTWCSCATWRPCRSCAGMYKRRFGIGNHALNAFRCVTIYSRLPQPAKPACRYGPAGAYLQNGKDDHQHRNDEHARGHRQHGDGRERRGELWRPAAFARRRRRLLLGGGRAQRTQHTDGVQAGSQIGAQLLFGADGDASFAGRRWVDAAAWNEGVRRVFENAYLGWLMSMLLQIEQVICFFCISIWLSTFFRSCVTNRTKKTHSLGYFFKFSTCHLQKRVSQV